jgi:anti-sigma factor RsiW
MHRLIENHLEEALSKSGLPEDHAAGQHLKQCAECRVEVDAMREHSALFRDFAAPVGMDPHPGFYARVLERIEAQRPVSIWGLFTESLWGRRLATASLTVALLLGGYVVSSERFMNGAQAAIGLSAERVFSGENPADGPVLAAAVNSSPDAVFMDLVSYRGR